MQQLPTGRIMDIVELIKHPKNLDRDTLYELRSMLALYPYFQSARLLLLQNLFLLHDPSFDEELRKAAIYITDRRVIFHLIEAGHYQLATLKKEKPSPRSRDEQDCRTLSLIDNFLESLPKEEEESEKKTRRKPTPADAAVDYVAYLLESGFDDNQIGEAPQLIGQNLIDTFIENDRGKRVLNEHPTLRPDLQDDEPQQAPNDAHISQPTDEYYTETLSRIYIKQKRYEKALDIVKQLNENESKKSPFYADQMRFLEKLIINNKKSHN